MNVVPDLRRSLEAMEARYWAEQREKPLREAWLAELEDDFSIRALGTRRWLRLGVQVAALRQHEERFGDDPAVWLLAAIMADVNETFWEGGKVPMLGLAQEWCAWHVGAPMIAYGQEGKAVAYWVNAAREALPKLRRYWFNHILALALVEPCPVWAVRPPYTLKRSMEMGVQVEAAPH